MTRRLAAVAVLVAASQVADAQGVPKLDWRRIGNSALDLALANPATGPVSRVWYSEDGAQLYARNQAGRIFVTSDFENWTLLPRTIGITPPAIPDIPVPVRPEQAVRIRTQGTSLTKVYAVGRFVYKSEDAGRNWANLTRDKSRSLIGDGVADLAVSPKDSDEIVAAAGSGLWRSIDGGLSWTGLNQALPNLAVRRILGFPLNTRGVRIAIDEQPEAFEWAPGEKNSWRPAADDASMAVESELKRATGAALNARITAVAVSGEYIYAGSADGQLWASSDKGATWRRNPDTAAAPVEQITIDAKEPRLAIAVLGARLAEQPATAKAPHVLRILNAGAFWDDLTANLPDVAVHGVAEDRSSGAVYVATDRGLFMAYEDLVNAGPATQWTAVDALPDAAVMDVRLDAGGNQLYVAVDGFGIYATPAPHRFRDARLVNAADWNTRPAAPGALLSVLGANVRSAQIGASKIPVLAAGDAKSEIQVPFEIAGTSLALALDSTNGPLTLGIPLQPTAPAIFVDRDGTPVVLDADSGVMLDAMTPAHSNGRLQILAAGMGKVRPSWPAGVQAPVENPPQVVAQVRAYLDRQPVEVTRAVLAPGYVGFYLVEVQLPKLVNYGPAELYIEADGQPSNRVRVYIEP